MRDEKTMHERFEYAVAKLDKVDLEYGYILEDYDFALHPIDLSEFVSIDEKTDINLEKIYRMVGL